MMEGGIRAATEPDTGLGVKPQVAVVLKRT